MIFHFLEILEFGINFHLYFFDRKYVLSEEEFQRKMCKNWEIFCKKFKYLKTFFHGAILSLLLTLQYFEIMIKLNIILDNQNANIIMILACHG